MYTNVRTERTSRILGTRHLASHPTNKLEEAKKNNQRMKLDL
jgi:hypothetical protein